MESWLKNIGITSKRLALAAVTTFRLIITKSLNPEMNSRSLVFVLGMAVGSRILTEVSAKPAETFYHSTSDYSGHSQSASIQPV